MLPLRQEHGTHRTVSEQQACRIGSGPGWGLHGAPSVRKSVARRLFMTLHRDLVKVPAPCRDHIRLVRWQVRLEYELLSHHKSLRDEPESVHQAITLFPGSCLGASCLVSYLLRSTATVANLPPTPPDPGEASGQGCWEGGQGVGRGGGKGIPPWPPGQQQSA